MNRENAFTSREAVSTTESLSESGATSTCISLRGARLSPLGTLVPPQIDEDDCGAVGGIGKYSERF
jgi:hypothetical protein